MEELARPGSACTDSMSSKRRLDSDDSFFEEGNIVCQRQNHKYACVSADDDYEDEDAGPDLVSEFVCHQKNCNQRFTSISTYEMHYNAVHKNGCSSCRRSFPNRHLLDLHITEFHDPLFGFASYRCLVEDCSLSFLTRVERAKHLVSAHEYTAEFRFVKSFLPRKRGKNCKKKSSENSPEPNICVEEGKMKSSGVGGKQKKPERVIAMETENVDTEENGATDTKKSQSRKQRKRDKKKLFENSPVQTDPNVLEKKISETVDGKSKKSETTEMANGVDNDENAATGARKFQPRVPTTISFGHGVSRGFYRVPGCSKRNNPWQEKNACDVDTTSNIQKLTLDDLAECLETS